MAKEIYLSTQQNLPQLDRPAELLARGQRTRRIDGPAIGILIAPASHPVEVLQAKTDRVHELVTRGAGRIRAVPVGEAMVALVLADQFLRHRGQVGESARWPFEA